MYLYVFPCVCAVYMCVSPCTTILLCLLSCFLTLVLSLAFFRSFLSRTLSLPLRSFRALPHIYQRTRPFRSPFSPSLPYFLTFRVRSPLFDVLDSRISMGLNSTSRRETARNWTGTRNRSSFDLASRVDSRYLPPSLCVPSRAHLLSFFSLVSLSFLPIFPSLSLIDMHSLFLSLSLSLSLALSVSICDESSPKILYSVAVRNKKL